MTPRLSDVPLLPVFFPVTTARNFLLFGFILALLIYYTRSKRTDIANQPVVDEQSGQVSISQ
jgi:hypothetical protein